MSIILTCIIIYTPTEVCTLSKMSDIIEVQQLCKTKVSDVQVKVWLHCNRYSLSEKTLLDRSHIPVIRGHSTKKL